MAFDDVTALYIERTRVLPSELLLLSVRPPPSIGKPSRCVLRQPTTASAQEVDQFGAINERPALGLELWRGADSPAALIMKAQIGRLANVQCPCL